MQFASPIVTMAGIALALPVALLLAAGLAVASLIEISKSLSCRHEANQEKQIFRTKEEITHIIQITKNQ